MKDLLDKYNEYRIQAIWDITYGAEALTKFGIAVLDYDLTKIRMPAPIENATAEELINRLSIHFESLKNLSSKLVRYAGWISLPVDLQRDGKPFKAELQKKLSVIQKSIANELQNIPRAIAEIFATVKFPYYSIEHNTKLLKEKDKAASKLLELNLSLLENEKDYLEKIMKITGDFNNLKNSIQTIFFNLSQQLNNLIPNKEIRENVISCLMPNADKLIKAMNGRLIEIARELISKDPRVMTLISLIKEVGVFNRLPEESDESYLKRLESLRVAIQKNLIDLNLIVEITRDISELVFNRNESVLIQEIAGFAANLIRKQKAKLQFALDQIDEITKDVKKPLRKLIERAANDVIGPNAATPKIILVTYHSSDREVLGIPSGDHTGIILCGGGREPLCLSFYGNRNIVRSEKSGLEGMILKALHIPAKIIAGHFRDFEAEIAAFERVELTTADTVVFECGDEIGLNFDAVYQWAQEQIKTPRDYDFRTANCAAIGMNALKIGAEGNEKNKEYNQLLEDSRTLGTVVPRQLHEYAKKIMADIDKRRGEKFAIALVNDTNNLIPPQNDVLKTEMMAFQSELEVRIRSLKQIQNQERENPFLSKKFKPEELAFLEDVSDAYNLIISNLPPQSENFHDREIYRYRFNEALANLDHAIYTKFDRDLVGKSIYQNVRTEISRLRQTINPDESKSAYYKFTFELEQILHIYKIEFNSICGKYQNINDYQDQIKRRNKLIIQQVQQALNPVITREKKYALTYNADRLITVIKVVRTEKNVLIDEHDQLVKELKTIRTARVLSKPQKKQQEEQKLHQIQFNEQLQKHYSQLSQSLIGKYNEINQHLYLESPDAKSTLSNNVPFIQLWKSLTNLEPDLTENYSYLINKVIAQIANRNATPLPKPWFFQFWKKPAYKEQQAQYAFADILQNKQMPYNEKIKQIKQILDENRPLNYEVWFNGKAVKERKARFAEMKEKAYLICMFDAFLNSEMDRETLIKKIGVLINESKNSARKQELDKLKEGLTLLYIKYSSEEIAANTQSSLLPPQVVPAPVPTPVASIVRNTAAMHLPTASLSLHKGEHYFEELHRKHHEADSSDNKATPDVAIEVGGPRQK